MEVTIFKTNVHTELIAQKMILELQAKIPDFIINFDLEDCDRILRISGNRSVSDMVIQLLHNQGYECLEIL